MSLILYSSIGWASEKQTIIAGGGLTGPLLLSATSVDPNTVRLTFDRKLMLEYRQNGVYHAGTLDLASYRITKVEDSSGLEVVRVLWVDDTHIDLLTANQQVFNYRVTCVAGGVMDFQGNTITQQTADFIGQQRTTYTTPSSIRLFTSGYPGMQEDLTEDFYPDLEAPYLTNRYPSGGDVNVSCYTNILLDIVDDGLGVDLTTVRIWVEGVLAYRGDLDTFLAPFNGVLSARSVVPKGYRFVIDKTEAYSEYTVIVVAVEARDLAVISNLLSTSYSFQTVDTSAPYIDPTTQNPPAGSVNVPANTNLTIDVLDVGAGVDAATVWIKVNGVYAWLSDTPQTGFSVSKTTITNGYCYVVDPDSNFSSYQLVTVDVHASDLALPANTLDTTYSFRTEDTEAPYILARNPAQGDTDVSVWHPVNVTIVDAGSGVDATTVVIVIAGVTAWLNDTAQPGFEGSIKTTVVGGFAYSIVHTDPFLTSTTIDVRVACDDLYGNTFDATYSFDTEIGVTPRIEVLYPVANQVNIETNVAIRFNITDANLDLDPSAVFITINNIKAYQYETMYNGFITTRTTIPGGYGYEITSSVPYIYGGTVSVFIFAKDFSHASTQEAFSFDVMLSPDCFTGPLTVFEEKVIVPFTADVPYLELIRSNLIQSFVKINPITATRAIFLQGHVHELSVILRDLVPIPTVAEQRQLLCKRRSLLTVAELIPEKRVWLQSSMRELAVLGVPLEHRQLIATYMGVADEVQFINLMCFVVLLAKSLE